ncbi:MAG: class I SAM-dependent methyltransferase [Candidatus Sericytochromatia bacterium]
MSQVAPWWEAFYTNHYAETLFQLDRNYLDSACDFIREHLQLQPGQTVLDQCCGIGNISLLLGKQGISVTGIEQSLAYVRQAQARAQQAKLNCQFIAADAFTYVSETPMDAAFNWHTSFGYTADDRQNRRMLETAFASLKPGGYFLLDFLNLPYVLKHFRATMITYHQTQEGDVEVIRESRPDLISGMLNQLWTFVYPQEERRQVQETGTRMYLPYQLGEMLKQSGFELISYFGGLKGEPLSLDSSRCICLARRPV